MQGLKVGVLAPHTGAAAGPESLRQVATSAEEMGFDSLWCGDHVVLPAEQQSSYPYGSQDADDSYEVPPDRPFLEPMSTLGFLAAVTQKITIGVSVAILPYRSPALWAKTVGTVNLLAHGRMVLGAGVGWLAEEFAVLGSDFQSRGRRVDETLRFLRQAWDTDGPIEFHGEFIQVPGMYINPSRGAAASPPVWIGGNGMPALRRTAAFGDAWHPHIMGTPPRALVEGLDRIRELADSPRSSERIGAAIHCPLVLADRIGGNPWEIGRIEGPPDFLQDTMQEYRAAGLDHIIFTFGGSARRRIGILEVVAEALSLSGQDVEV
jgi:probable F420-dependent oxidoreductase